LDRASSLDTPRPLITIRRAAGSLAARLPAAADLSTPRSSKARAHTKEAIVTKIRPLQDRIIVKRVQEEEKTKGGIIIPDTAKEKPIEGKVIAVGNGKVQEDGKVRPLDVKAGDRILFSKYAGTEIKIDGEEHLIMREDDILGVIEG
jgi:chaperonin GroES